MGSGSPAELLVTEKAELAVQENKETKERMLQLVITSLVLGSAVAAPQDYQSYLSQLHQYRMEYLPESVNSYINKTWEEGRDVAYDLYDENLPEGVERMIQGMIRLCRQMMVAAADKEAEFWSKMKQLEVQFYQMKSASADTAASLRDWVTAAFQTMNEIDLNAIGGSSDILVDEPRAN